MRKARLFGKKLVFSLDHVEVAVVGKFRTKTIGWLARRTEAYAVRHDYKKFLGVKRLALAIKFGGEAGARDPLLVSVVP